MASTSRPILIVENNIFLEGILSAKLEKEGFVVVKAKNGIDALEKSIAISPSLIVLDILPSDVVIFFGVMRKLVNEKKLEKQLVLVLSNSTENNEKEEQKFIQLGASSYLIKAYTDTSEIIENIKKLAEKPIDEEVQVQSLNINKPELQEKDGDHVEKSIKEKSTSPKFEPKATEQKILKGDIERISIMAEKNEQDDLAIVNLVDYIIKFGYIVGASDVHFKPEKETLIARMRIDGVLRDVFILPKKIHPEIITRIKVLGGMRTDEHQAAQDGRFRTNIQSMDHQFDVRVSIVPTYHGEDSVLRLLVEKSKINSVNDMPFSKKDKDKIIKAIQKPYGMILATGPTGSGKTTTLYTILKELNTKDVSIITIEDPIEYSLKGINQIQVNSRTDLTFANGLRSILRQDPDIIMVGEIRDKETAGIAVNAALTGHKLLSTLHTNDAPTTLPRLLDMGVEPFLIASTVNVALGQRLVRMLCQKCKKEKKLNKAERATIIKIIPESTLKTYEVFYEAKGCDSCSDGYSGRIGIYEVMEVDEEIRNAIIQEKDSSAIKQIAIKSGMTTLLEDGIEKASRGLTTLEEIIQVAQD